MTASLIKTALSLAKANPRRPSQADLRRAVSTAYYAMFDCLSSSAADRLIGVGEARRSGHWRRVYRALDHGSAKSACQRLSTRGLKFISEFASLFVVLQPLRHQADYDPHKQFTRAEALEHIKNAERAIHGFRKSARADLLELAVELHFKDRNP